MLECCTVYIRACVYVCLCVVCMYKTLIGIKESYLVRVCVVFCYVCIVVCLLYLLSCVVLCVNMNV